MPRRGLSPERVAVAGADLADEIGFENVTPAELARRLGVRTASLYAHVASAADLRVRIAAVALDELADRTADAIAGRGGRDALEAMMNAYRDFAREHPGRFAAATWQPGADERVLAAGRRHAELSRAVLRGYDLPPDVEPHAIRLVGSTLRGFVTLEAGGSLDQSRPPAAQTWPHVVDGMHLLLSTWPSPSPEPDDEREHR